MTKDNWIKACKRCGKPYPVKAVMVCPCHPMFDEGYNWDGGHIDFKTPEDAQKCLELISQVEKDAIEKTNKRWRLRVEKLKEKEMVWNNQMTYGRGEVAIHNGGRQEALSDLLEDKNL